MTKQITYKVTDESYERIQTLMQSTNSKSITDVTGKALCFLEFVVKNQDAGSTFTLTHDDGRVSIVDNIRDCTRYFKQ